MKKLINFLFYIYTFLCLLLPAADLILSKKIVFAMLLAISVVFAFLQRDFKFNNYNIERFFLLFSILLAGAIFSLSDSNGNPIFLITSCLPFLLCIFLKDTVNGIKCIKTMGCVLSLAVILLAVLPSISKPLSIGANVLFLNLNSGFLGERTFGSIKLTMIHFRTSPILLIPFSLYFIDFCDKRKFKFFAFTGLTGTAILLSASRGLILFSFLSIYLICFFNINKKTYRKFFFLFTVAAAFGLSFILASTNVFDTKEESNSVKIGHIESFNELVNEHPSILLFGQGTGSSYYSKGFNRVVWQTEATFFDILRYWGIFGCILFIFIIALPQKKISLKYIIPFLFYYINAFTNPLIFNSTGMLVIAVYILLVSDKSSVKYIEKSNSKKSITL